MKFRDAPEVQLLLSGAVEFDWDKGNTGKSERKHGISDAVVESILASPFVFMGEIVEPMQTEPRFVALSHLGHPERGVCLIFTVRGNKVRPISCRPMRDTERSLYEEAKR
jgi:uncharacterized DUF497 family protein